MKIADIRAGMRLRNTVGYVKPQRNSEVVVTALTTHTYDVDSRFRPIGFLKALALTMELPSFEYRIPDDIEMQPWEDRTGKLADYHHMALLASKGEIYYEPMESPELETEKREREAMLDVMYLAESENQERAHELGEPPLGG